MAGLEVQDLNEDVEDPGPINASTDDESDDDYNICLQKLDGEFHYDDNVPYERHLFPHLRLQEGESADKILARLKMQARYCNFGESLEDNMRDQLIKMLPDLDWKKKLLEFKNISLQEAMDKVRSWESAREQASQTADHNHDMGASKSAVKTKQVKTCFNCGRSFRPRLEVPS